MHRLTGFLLTSNCFLTQRRFVLYYMKVFCDFLCLLIKAVKLVEASYSTSVLLGRVTRLRSFIRPAMFDLELERRWRGRGEGAGPSPPFSYLLTVAHPLSTHFFLSPAFRCRKNLKW